LYFGKHLVWLKYFTYRSVPVLASNYKQHILSSAEVTTACYSLAERYVKYVYLNLFGWRGGATFIKHFTGGSSYKCFGTSGLCPDVTTYFQARVHLCGAPTEIGSVHPSTTNNARAAEQVFITSLTGEFY
jgi:hypothetical protein